MEESTLLHRQVHPLFVQEDKISSQVFEQIKPTDIQISSQVFTPSKKDEKKLSVYNGKKYSPEQAYNHYIQQKFQSAGVVAVSKGECKSVSLNCIEDNTPFDGHSHIDFTPCSNYLIKAKAKQLKSYASRRGWQYKP